MPTPVLDHEFLDDILLPVHVLFYLLPVVYAGLFAFDLVSLRYEIADTPTEEKRFKRLVPTPVLYCE